MSENQINLDDIWKMPCLIGGQEAGVRNRKVKEVAARHHTALTALLGV